MAAKAEKKNERGRTITAVLIWQSVVVTENLKSIEQSLARESILTQEVMGSEGNVRGGGGGAYRLVKSRSLNFFPINDRALSTCCCAPEGIKHKSKFYGRSQSIKAKIFLILAPHIHKKMNY